MLAALCFVYAAAMWAWYPQLPVNDDESQYIRQARVLLEGRSTIELRDPWTDEIRMWRPSSYPIGTAAVIAPFIAAGGPQAAWLAPMLSLFLAIFVTGRWLESEGHSPLFAALLMAHVPANVMGRVAMSDPVSMAVIAVGFFAFWRGLRPGAGPWPWLAAGFVAGASAVLRPPNVLVFVAFCIGAVVRWDRHWWALALGGVVGISLRFLSSSFVLGSAFGARQSYLFEPHTVMDRLPLFLLGVVVLLPGGLLFACLYRGKRRPELVATAIGFFLFFLFQRYSTFETGALKRIILGLRYFLPLLPLLVFAMGEAVPRLWAQFLARREEAARARLRGWARVAVAAGLVGTALGSVAIHWFMFDWAESQAKIAAVVGDYGLEGVLIHDPSGTKKFVDELSLGYTPLVRDDTDPARVHELANLRGGLTIILLDRSDSAWWLDRSRQNQAYIDRIVPAPELVVDERPTSTDRLRIWRVEAESAAAL